MKIMRRPVMAAYAPIIGRDLEWFESDVKSYIGKNVASLRKFLKDQDFKCDFTAMDVYGPDTGSETWVLMTEAGKVKVNFVYDSKSVNRPRPKGDTSFSALRNANAGKRIEGGVTSAYVSDEQDQNLIADEEERLFSSTRFKSGKRSVKAASEFGSESLRHMNDYDEKYGNSPAKRMAMLFPYFLQDVKDYFYDVDSSWFDIKGTQFYDSNYDIDFEVIPIFDGSELPFGTVLIEYRAQESPSLTAKCQENGDIIATGDRFIDILVEVERYIEETYTEYADNLPAEFWD